MALREAKYWIASLRWAGQYNPALQRATASPSIRSISEWQTGQSAGKIISSDLAFLTGRVLVICGMTSAARLTTTVSPIFIPSRSISSWLCKLARRIVTPPTNTGSNIATGVTAPVRPTWNSTSSRIVCSSWAGNLCAVAQRGARETKPSCSWRLISSIL